MTIQSILRNKSTVISVRPDNTVAETVQVLAEHRIGAVLVMDGPELVGVFSERDIVRAMSRQPSGVRALAVSTLMTPAHATVPLSATIVEAMQMMTERRVRHLPVIEGGRVVGVISIGDVVKARLDRQASEVESMKAYVTGIA